MTGDYYRFIVSGSVLYFQQLSSGVLNQSSIAFDPVNHRFWRIRHNSIGNIGFLVELLDEGIFQTSPNGVNWNDRFTVQAPRSSAITMARIELGGGTSHSVATPAKSIFDNFVLAHN